jgi:hypothetical protein
VARFALPHGRIGGKYTNAVQPPRSKDRWPLATLATRKQGMVADASLGTRGRQPSSAFPSKCCQLAEVLPILKTEFHSSRYPTFCSVLRLYFKVNEINRGNRQYKVAQLDHLFGIGVEEGEASLNDDEAGSFSLTRFAAG